MPARPTQLEDYIRFWPQQRPFLALNGHCDSAGRELPFHVRFCEKAAKGLTLILYDDIPIAILLD